MDYVSEVRNYDRAFSYANDFLPYFYPIMDSLNLNCHTIKGLYL